MKLLPKRWSRAKRKRVRACVNLQRDIFRAAWHLHFVVSPALKKCLDAIWGDQSQYIDSSGNILRSFIGPGPFVDDAEFMP